MKNQRANNFLFRYRSDEIEVLPETMFANDKLGREPFVTAVTELLGAIREPFVVALNAPWGSGKTTTLRLLEPSLAAAGITTVTFNAWEVDGTTDPLVPLVATLHERLLELKGQGATIDQAKVDRLKTLGSAIVKHGLIAAVKVATAGIVDVSGVADGIVKAALEATGKAGEDLTGDLIDVFKREKQAAEKFRVLLRELTNHVRAGAQDDRDSAPLVLVIDELDRCRPTFAVAMLERIKHFFSVPGLVFVLALDLEQLKASTRKVYGADLDANEYLRRFVDLELRLPRAKVGQMVDSMLTNCGADAFFAARVQYPSLREDRKWIVILLQELAHHFDLSPRLVQRMISRLMLVLRQTPENAFLDPLIVIFMIFLRIRDDELLRALVKGQAHAEEIMMRISTFAPNGSVFCDSKIGTLIEAHILFAHKEKHDYVAKFLEDANMLENNSFVRVKRVARQYETLNNSSLDRMWLDLEHIDQRINLVVTDIKVDQ